MYYFDGRIRYSETDSNGILRPSSAIHYFQDCSTFQSEDIGRGIEYLEEHHVVWLMNSWQVEINRLPAFGEWVRVGTWASRFQGLYGYRNFVMDDKEGRHLIQANSIWVFFDTKRGRPVKVTEEEVAGYPIEPPLQMKTISRKISLPEQMEKRAAFPVRKGHIDTNGHVNNGQSIQMAEEYLPDGFLVSGIRAEYRKAIYPGGTVYPSVALSEKEVVVNLADESGAPQVVVIFQKKQGEE